MSCPRGLYKVVITIKDLKSDFSLELSNLPAQQKLRDVEAFCSFAEAQFARDCKAIAIYEAEERYSYDPIRVIES
jgi:hypothetical protein